MEVRVVYPDSEANTFLWWPASRDKLPYHCANSESPFYLYALLVWFPPMWPTSDRLDFCVANSEGQNAPGYYLWSSHTVYGFHRLQYTQWRLLHPRLPCKCIEPIYAEWSIPYIRGVWLVSLWPCFIEIPVFNANSVDPDQTSDPGLHCLPMSILWDARLKLVKPVDKIRTWQKLIEQYCTLHYYLNILSRDYMSWVTSFPSRLHERPARTQSLPFLDSWLAAEYPANSD